MTCANCESLALYVYQITHETHILYCNKHLPKFLEPLRKAGNLKTTDEFQRLRESLTPTSEEEPKKKKKAKKADENNEGNS